MVNTRPCSGFSKAKSSRFLQAEDDSSSQRSGPLDVEHSSSGESNSQQTGGEERKGEYEQMEQYAAAETAVVKKWRTVVIISIVLIGAIVSVLTFLFLAGAESDSAQAAVSGI